MLNKDIITVYVQDYEDIIIAALLSSVKKVFKSPSRLL